VVEQEVELEQAEVQPGLEEETLPAPVEVLEPVEAVPPELEVEQLEQVEVAAALEEPLLVVLEVGQLPEPPSPVVVLAGVQPVERRGHLPLGRVQHLQEPGPD